MYELVPVYSLTNVGTREASEVSEESILQKHMSANDEASTPLY